MKYDKIARPFVPVNVRIVRVLICLFCSAVSVKDYFVAQKVLRVLVPNLGKEFRGFFSWFWKIGRRVKVSQKIAEYFFKGFDPKTATTLHALILLQENPEESLKLFDSCKFQKWFMNSSDSFSLLSLLYMKCKKSGIKSAKKAFALLKSDETFQVLAQALLKEGKTEDLKKIMKDFNPTSLKVKDFCCSALLSDWKHFQDMHERDPRNGKIAAKLMNHYLSQNDEERAVQVANRHIEYRGSSLKVRGLLDSLLK